MKHIFFIVVLFIAFGCSTGKKENEVITVSILPQKYFVEQIAGDLFPINVMLPPGASPADYEPTPQQIQNMSNSSFYFYVGHLGFEKSWMKRFTETAEDVEYISCSKQIDLLRSDIKHKGNGSNHEHGTDPHIWTSPENVKTISRTITNALSKSYPENAEVFNANLEKFITKIDSLDYYIRTELADTTNSTFMIFHPALGYYARDYHLEQLSIEFEGKSPSPAHMKKMIDAANTKNINTVFVQSQFETSKAKAVAKEINAKIVNIDPLAEKWLDEMYTLTAKMKKALTTNAKAN